MALNKNRNCLGSVPCGTRTSGFYLTYIVQFSRNTCRFLAYARSRRFLYLNTACLPCQSISFWQLPLILRSTSFLSACLCRRIHILTRLSDCVNLCCLVIIAGHPSDLYIITRTARRVNGSWKMIRESSLNHPCSCPRCVKRSAMPSEIPSCPYINPLCRHLGLPKGVTGSPSWPCI